MDYPYPTERAEATKAPLNVSIQLPQATEGFATWLTLDDFGVKSTRTRSCFSGKKDLYKIYIKKSAKL